MANNRLYILDKTSGDKFLLAKSFGEGWNLWWPGSINDDQTELLLERINIFTAWINSHDLLASKGNCFYKTQLTFEAENDTE